MLSFLSFRDALKYKKVPVFSVVTLKLPEGVKVLIRKIAMESWSGPAVALAGFGCAFLVTLLDALCTGQVYVPVLALISRDPGAWRSFALLALYPSAADGEDAGKGNHDREGARVEPVDDTGENYCRKRPSRRGGGGLRLDGRASNGNVYYRAFGVVAENLDVLRELAREHGLKRNRERRGKT